ncbi:MAG: GMC family oxidoreductase, partial [Actinomycetota bacterium]
MDQHYDVVVIGAGSAGCVLSARLSEDPSCEVLLVEAGPDYSTREQLPLDIADGGRLPSDRSSSHDWGWSSVPGATGVSPVPLPRGWLVGGSSAVNGTFALRGAPEDYDAWEAAGNPGWSFAEVLEEFRCLETDLDFGDRAWHGADGPVPIRRYRPEEQSELARAFIAAAQRVGHPSVADHNQPGAVGVGPLPVNTKDRLRMSAALTHLEPARGRPNLVVRGRCPVDRIEVNGGRVSGVRLTDGELIGADLVVLAAGAYASPAVLLRSGIGSAEDVRALGIDPVVHLDGVGRNLIDHVLVSVDVAIVAEAAVRPNYQTMVTMRSDDAAGPPDLHLFSCGPYDARHAGDGNQLAPLAVGLIDPASRGQLWLTSSDPGVSPSIDPGYLTEQVDIERLAVGVERVREILDTDPLRSLAVGTELRPGSGVGDADLKRALPGMARTYHHPVGTCRMGPDPDHGAVVDASGHLYGVDGLIVSDASIMPTVPRANTNLPTMMLAERIAKRLTARTAQRPA